MNSTKMLVGGLIAFAVVAFPFWLHDFGEKKRAAEAAKPPGERKHQLGCEQIYKLPEVWRCGLLDKYGNVSWVHTYVTKEPYNISGKE
jgi:hypothetical protein